MKEREGVLNSVIDLSREGRREQKDHTEREEGEYKSHLLIVLSEKAFIIFERPIH
jgi:hypothetical protein